MKLGITDKKALVIGGSGGIGRSAAGYLRDAGAHVTLASRTAAAEDGFQSLQFDLMWSADRMMETIGDQGYDILVVSAGNAAPKPFMKTTDQDFEHMWRLHCLGPVNATKACLPHMTENNNGRIVQVGSAVGIKGRATWSTYAQAKAAMHNAVESLAYELAGEEFPGVDNVVINVIAPGYTETALARSAGGGDPDREAAALAQMAAENPVGKIIPPDHTGARIAFLCSAFAGTTNGAVEAVGGQV